MAQSPRYQGEGSSVITPTKLVNVLDCLTEAKVDYVYAQGYEISLKKTKSPQVLINDALTIAKTADVVLLFIGLTLEYESEGFDRQNISLPENHNKLVELITSVNPNVVVVLSGGSPVSIPWFETVKGLLNSYLAGQAGAEAIVDILTGIVNPSGKLAETYPFELADTPCSDNFPGSQVTVEYRESIYVGYRYYEKIQKPVRFPFGFGLSYTTFEYSNLILEKSEIQDSESLVLSFSIENTGETAGSEIAQLYVPDIESTIFRPNKELKGFKKVFLHPNEKVEISFSLDKRSFAFYNTLINDWSVEEGEFEILIGASSQDIRLRSRLLVKSDKIEITDFRQTIPIYYSGDPSKATPQDFELLIGRELPPTIRDPAIPLTLQDTLDSGSHTKWGQRILSMIKKGVIKNDEPSTVMYYSTLVQMPIQNLITMTGGLFTEEMGTGLLRVINGDSPGKGFFMVLKGLPHLLFNIKSFMNENL